MSDTRKHPGGRRRRADFATRQIRDLEGLPKSLSWHQIACQFGIGIGTARRACGRLLQGLVTSASEARQNPVAEAL